METLPPYRYLSPPATVPRFDIMEWFLEAPPHHVANPFLDALLSGVIITPRGQEIIITGFCDSEDGSLYRLRFMPAQEGDYRYRLCFQSGDRIVRTQGTFRCVPSTRPGVVRVDPDHPRHFLREDGSRVFVLSKTAWLLAVAKNALDFIDQAAARGFNCLRFALETDYFFTEVGKDVWPWGGSRLIPDFTRFAVRFWQRVEALIQRAAQRGILMQPVIFCRLRREPPAPIPDPEMERYWDYLLARLSSFANILAWELFNEHAEDRPYQAYMASYLRTHDPYRHLICTSFGTTEDAAWPDAEWLDLAINHSCTSSDPARHGLDTYYRRVALNVRRYGKPAWCNESGRERLHGNDDPVHRRKQAWIWNISGAYWSYHTWAGCEGIETGSWGPGEEYYRYMRPFWETWTRWWEMEPDELGILARPRSDFAYLLRSEKEAVVYLVNELSGAITPAGELALILPAGEYELAFYYPADGQYRAVAGIWQTSADGILTVHVPAFTDDLIVHLKRVDGR